MKKDILVPFDGSPNAIEALKLAVNLAKLLQEKIIALNVQPSFHTAHTKVFFGETTIHNYQQYLFDEVMESAKSILAQTGVEYELKLRVGDAKEEICQEAGFGENGSETGRCTADGVRMIVMGSRGMNPMLGGFLGSVSYGVLHVAQCPVTIIPYACPE
jgi:nucleotide-binding universal stress UspA family protein